MGKVYRIKYREDNKWKSVGIMDEEFIGNSEDEARVMFVEIEQRIRSDIDTRESIDAIKITYGNKTIYKKEYNK
jgi:hypothetical protein